MSHEFMGMDEQHAKAEPAPMPWRPAPNAVRIELSQIVEMYFDDMGLQGEARREAYAQLARKIEAQKTNAAQPKERER